MQGVQTIRGLRVQAAAFLNSNNQESVAEVNYCSDRAEPGGREAEGRRSSADYGSAVGAQKNQTGRAKLKMHVCGFQYG